MNQNLIYYPCLALILYTFAILAWMFRTRVKAIKDGKVDYRHFKTYSTDCKVPHEVLQIERNFSNLLEVPPIFYIICAFTLMTKQVDQVQLVLSWGYVFLRLIHSLVHITSNKLQYRVLFYGGSWIVLVVMAIRLGVSLY